MSRNPGAQMSSMLHMSRSPDPDVQFEMSKCPVCPAPFLHPAAVYTVCWTPRGDMWESSILLPSIHPQRSALFFQTIGSSLNYYEPDYVRVTCYIPKFLEFYAANLGKTFKRF